MFTIYGRTNSSNVRKVLWLCAELGLDDYERLDYGRGFAPCDTPEYRKLNPNMLVPTLVDGDLVVWESNAILRYLAAKYGADEIYPAGLANRAIVEQWLEWQTTTSNIGIRDLFFALTLKRPAYMDHDVQAKSLVLASEAMRLLDAQLAATGAFVTGAALTIADCALGMFVHRWFVLPIERQEFPALAAYYERLKDRAPFQEWIIGQGV